MKKTRKTYAPELKAKAVSLVENGATMARVAKDLHVPYSSIANWLTLAKKARNDHVETARAAAKEIRPVTRAVKVDRELRIGRTASGRAFLSKSGAELVLEAEDVKFLLETLQK